MFQTSPGLTIYLTLLAFVLGAAMGSFLDCLGSRLAQGRSMRGRSQCPSCSRALTWRELIPVFSYLRQRGRCAHCGVVLSPRYLWSELLTGLLFAALLLCYGLSWACLQWLLLASLLMAIACADLEEQLVPDSLLLAGLLLRVVFILTSGSIGPEALGALIGGLSISLPLLLLVLFMDKVLGRETMGGGDIKLLFMAGTYFSWQANLLALLLACVIGLLFAAAAKKRGRPFPFAPAIAAAYCLAMFVGEYLVNWYMTLF